MSAPRTPLVTADLPGRPCSIAAALDLVGDRWSLLAVREVMFGNRRFSEIARNTGAPRDRLAARLKELVNVGIIERRQYQDAPPRADYHLTPAGRELAPVLQALLEWGDKWALADAPLTLMHHGHRLRSQVRCATCGEKVWAKDVRRIVNVDGWDLAGPT